MSYLISIENNSNIDLDNKNDSNEYYKNVTNTIHSKTVKDKSEDSEDSILEEGRTLTSVDNKNDISLNSPPFQGNIIFSIISVFLNSFYTFLLNIYYVY